MTSHVRYTTAALILVAAVFASFAGDAATHSVLLWDSADASLDHWSAPSGLGASTTGGNLLLNIAAPDSRLSRMGFEWTPSANDTFLIRYRATSFVGPRTSGEIFYRNTKHAIDGQYYVVLPSLVLDGEWHDLRVPVVNSLRGGVDDWKDGGAVTELRLDLVNEAPGRIETSSIMLASGLREIGEHDVMVGARHYFVPTNSFTRTAPERYERALVLPGDSLSVWVHLYGSPAAQDAVNALEISGTDTQPVVLDASEGYRWHRVATVTGGRLAFAMSRPPCALFDAVLVVDGDAIPEDKPEKPLEPVASTITTMENLPPAFLYPYWTGSMMCHPGQLDVEQATAFFRRIIDIPANLESAWLQTSADDRVRVFINGQEVPCGVEKNSWLRPLVSDVTPMLVKGSKNCIALELTNDREHGAVLFDLTLNNPDHSCSKVVSDASWRSSIEAPDGWKDLAFDDTTWIPPELHPAPPGEPWTVEIPYLDKTWQTPTECAGIDCRREVKPGEPLAISMQLRSERPVAAGETVRFTLTDADTGAWRLNHELQLRPEQCSSDAAGIVSVSGLAIPTSPWWPASDIRVEIGMPGRTLLGPGDKPVVFHYVNVSDANTLESEVRDINGVPRLFVNGTPMYPMIGNGTGCHKQGTRESYARAGFNVEAMWVDGAGSPQWWIGPGEYDFTALDRNIVDDLDYNPEVLLLPIVWAAPPPWWQELHPEEVAKFSDGQPWQYYRSTPSFASERWRADAQAAIKAFVEHVESTAYASRILGYWVIGGVSAEWQGWGAHDSSAKRHLMDYSIPARDGFRSFLKQKYPSRAAEFTDAEIPSFEERIRHENGVFRDPATAAPSVDFNEFYSRSLADTLLACTRAAKEAAGRKKIVGVYFGYSLEYTNMNWCMQIAGHNALRRVLDSPDVDFLSAPPSYGVRAIGKSIGWMWPWRSIQTANKLVWVDDDTRTFLSGPCDYNPGVNLEQTISILRRNFGSALCRLCPQCFLSINSGRELDAPAIARDMRIFRRAGEYALAKGVAREAEIAVVVDEDSIKYLAYDDSYLPSGEIDSITTWNGEVRPSRRMVNTLMGDLVAMQRDRIARIGAPVDYLLWSDLPKRGLHYKCYIMLDCFQYDDAILQAVRDKIYGSDAVVLWCYAPGFLREGRAAIENMEALTGIKLGMVSEPFPPRTNIVDFTTPFADNSVPATFGVEYAFAPQFHVVDDGATPIATYQCGGAVSLATKKVGQARSIFCGSNKMPASLMRCMARTAGVHIYEDGFDPLDANENFISIHASTGGEKTFHLKQPSDVVDVFDGKILFRQVQAFTVQMQEESTRVFYTGNAEESGSSQWAEQAGH